MGFVVLHMEKAHGSDSGTTAHIERSIIPKNADPTRSHLNRRLIKYPDGVKDRSAAIQRRLEEAGLTRKVGSNQVRAIRINVSATPEDMERIQREGRLDEWCTDNQQFFADTFGKEIGGDIAEGKKTFLLITAYNALDEDGRRRLDAELASDLDRGEKLARVRAIYDSVGVRESAGRAIKHYYDKAMEMLDTIDRPEESKSALRELAEKLIKRMN